MNRVVLVIIFGFGLSLMKAQEFVPIRRIGISSSDDFSDLQPIGKEIGNSQLVVLSDWARANDGASYDAIGRLVNYLHEKKGFEVMLWELGTFEGQMMNEAFVRNDLDGGLSTMYKVWRESKSIQSLATYTINSHSTRSPLEMRGSSCQFHAFGKSNLIEYLSRNKEQLGLSALNNARSTKLDLLWTQPKRLKELSKKEFDELKNEIIELDLNVPEITHQLLQNMLWFVELERLRAFTNQNEVVKVVERFRAETTIKNLDWMLKNDLKGKKVILFGKWTEIMGKYRDSIFSIGITAQSGEVARPGQAPQKLEATGEGFLEHHLSKMEEKYLYLKPDPALKDYKSRLSNDWVSNYDGVIFLTEAYPNKGIK